MTSTRSDLPASGFPGQDILQTIPEGDIAPSRLIGARSFLIDRAVPACEFIDLPARKPRGRSRVPPAEARKA